MCADGSLMAGMSRVLSEMKSERDRLRTEIQRLRLENARLHGLADYYRNLYQEAKS